MKSFKKYTLVVLSFLVILAAMSGFIIALTTRVALFQIFLSLTPAVPLFSESNILVLGVDDAFGSRSDTIMVLHADPDKKIAAVLSVPRDTVANIPDRGLDKINHAFAYGGADLSRQTMEQLLNIPIPYYIIVNLSGIENIIDRLGGIMVNVEKRMFYDDYAGDLHIDLQPGRQRLNGKQAMGYLRFRHSDNDFARINRQQKFVETLAAQLMKRENIMRSPKLFLSFLSCIETNLNSRQTLGLSLALRGAYELGQVHMATLPGSDLMVDNTYYWKPDDQAVKYLVNTYFTNNKKLANKTGE